MVLDLHDVLDGLRKPLELITGPGSQYCVKDTKKPLKHCDLIEIEKGDRV